MKLFGKNPVAGIIGRAPEELTIEERFENAGKWMALELYTPTTLSETGGRVEVDLKLRRIRAVGNSIQDCMARLEQAGLDPKNFEYTQITPAFRW